MKNKTIQSSLIYGVIVIIFFLPLLFGQNQNNLEIKPNCPNALNLTWNEISQMTKQQIDGYYGGAPIGCKYYKFPNDSSSSISNGFIIPCLNFPFQFISLRL